MEFACERCGEKSDISDEMAAGRTVRVRCPDCGHVFAVAGLGVAAPPPSQPLRAVGAELSWIERGEAPAAPAAGAPDPEPAARGWPVAAIVGAAALAAAAAGLVLHLRAPRATTTANATAPSDSPPTPSSTATSTAAPTATAAAGARPATIDTLAALPPPDPLPEGGGRGSAAPAAAAPPHRRGAKRVVRLARSDLRLLDLLQKKEDASPAPVDRGELDAAHGSLDERQVARTVGASRKAFAACVTSAARRDPNLRLDGRHVTLTLTVLPQGAASDPVLDDARLDGSDLGTCLKRAGTRMVFPAFEGDPVSIEVPLTMSRGGD